MTSIISPILYATQMATKAQDSLHTASATLNAPRPMNAEFRIGIPEHNGPDSPDNPWFIDQPGRERGIYGVAAGHAREAVTMIDRALEYGRSFLSGDVMSAFSRAKEQAEAGVVQLTSPTTMPIDPHDVILQFDGAGLWLGLAKNLIALQDRPQVLPTPRLDEPITIQLPSPDSDVQ